jgi:hypothetical protein
MFDFLRGHTAKSLQQKGIAEFKRDDSEISRTAEKARSQGLDFDGEWDVIEDPRVVAENMRIAEEAARVAAAESARQLALQQQLIARMEMEAARIARQEEAARIGILKAHTATRLRDAASRHLRQLHDQLDQTIQETHCWRCGQRGRLPVEDDSLLRCSRPVPDEQPRVFFEARKAAVEAWKTYNDHRFGVELFRLDLNYHPALAHRFAQQRDCEVCGSRGTFHSDHLSGTKDIRIVSLYDGSKIRSGHLDIRFSAALNEACVEVPGRIYGTNWVPVLQLSKAEAKEWVASANRVIVTSRWLEWRKSRDEWDEAVRSGSIRPFHADPNSPHWWGRDIPQFKKVNVSSEGVDVAYVNPPPPPASKTVSWPARSKGFAEPPDGHKWNDPPRWIGGPRHHLFIKQGVEYAYSAQDPLSKEARIGAHPVAAVAPATIGRLTARQAHYAVLTAG